MIKHKKEDLMVAVRHLTNEMRTLNNLLDMASDEELYNLLLVTQQNKDIGHEVWLAFDTASLNIEQINTILLKVIASQR